MISLNTTNARTYLSSERTSKIDLNLDLLRDMHTLKLLNEISYFGVSNYNLTLKTTAVGLCNKTRLVVMKLSGYVLEAGILKGTNAGESVRKFPSMISYDMTNNKRQLLKNVENLLMKPVFNHKWLYVDISRVTRRRRFDNFDM
ncbi:hypothetical protein ACS0TY_030316 [Phlomoides rotata]